MARKKNPLLRTIIPLAAILVGVGIVVAVGINSRNQPRGPAQTASETQAEPATPVEDAAPEGEPSPDAVSEPDRPAGASEESAPAERGEDAAESASALEAFAVDPEPEAEAAGGVWAGELRVRVFEEVAEPEPIGALEGEGGHRLYIEFSSQGAGIASVQLGEGYYEEVDGEEHVEIQSRQVVEREGRDDLAAVPFAALGLLIEGRSEPVNLAAPGVWRPIPGRAGAFEAIVEDGQGREVLRLERRFVLDPGTFHMRLERRVVNRTETPLSVRWSESGPIDLPEPEIGYGGDKRRVRYGYLLSERLQAGDTAVSADAELRGRGAILGERGADRRYESVRSLWPFPRAENNGWRLVWIGFTGRYFSVALHPVFDPSTVTPGGEEKLFEQIQSIDRLVLNPYADQSEAVILTRIMTSPATVPAAGESALEMGLYAGPLLQEAFEDPLSEALNLDALIVYNFGGFCGEACTFGWLTHLLYHVLSFAYSFTGDWAVAIIILVLIVRTALHPITRWSQIRLRRFGIQMQAVAPKQQKLREKYKDDPKRMQQEMARLWKEEGINPAGALGCLPMLLQSPVWIALYATLYFAAELRHEPAFWGVFQAISGGEWRFLADLSSPDAALPLPSFMHFTPPLLGSLYGEVESVNLLPILMGILLYVQQKFLSPPPSASMTPEQEQQQKIMRIMFPLMLPVIMYPAPSGLSVYFITNSALGIIEYKQIRASAEKKGLLDPEKIKAQKAAKRAEGGGGGFLSRVQAMAEQRAEMQAQQGGKKKVQNVARPGKSEPPKRYKKRK